MHKSLVVIESGSRWFQFMANVAHLRWVSVDFHVFVQCATILKPCTAKGALNPWLFNTHVLRFHMILEALFCFEHFGALQKSKWIVFYNEKNFVDTIFWNLGMNFDLTGTYHITNTLIDSLVHFQHMHLEDVIRFEAIGIKFWINHDFVMKSMEIDINIIEIRSIAHFFSQIWQMNFGSPIGCTSLRWRFKICWRENRLWHWWHSKLRFSSSKWRNWCAVNVLFSWNFFGHLAQLKTIR